TERKKVEEENRKLRNYLSNIVNSMPSILVGVDPAGAVTQWNAAAEAATGVSAETAQGKLLGELMPALAPHMAKVKAAISTRKPQLQPKTPRQCGGEVRYDDITVYPLVSNGVEGAVIRVDDVTNQVRIEEMMIQSEKMLSVGGLAAGMAHEINNPLGVIIQAAQNIQRRLSPDLPANATAAQAAGLSLEALQTYLRRRDVPIFLEDIRQSGMRAAQIVHDMLSFSRKSESAPRPEDLRLLLDQTLELAGKDYDLKKTHDFRQIEVVREYAAEMPLVPCHASRIQQVFLNIFRNAAEAMDETRAQGRAPRLVLRAEARGGEARIEIEDNGPGMLPSVRRRAFEPFFTTKPPGQGTGLGLSVSYFIITQDHGGSLSVRSTPGAGSTFIIQLPITGKSL
ncbi:MAG TPA: ATP-binding protein, partial [Candidatus Brocadiia bacterium]|nr:ATP-binding protein [Candidatus Brocadiia bacterium]